MVINDAIQAGLIATHTKERAVLMIYQKNRSQNRLKQVTKRALLGHKMLESGRNGIDIGDKMIEIGPKMTKVATKSVKIDHNIGQKIRLSHV